MAWMTQFHIEAALRAKLVLTIASVDYQKYFDSFPPQFTAKLLRCMGLPPALIDMWEDMYSGLSRTINIGKHVGTPFDPTTGIGQGDSMSIMPAIALVSLQFDYLSAVAPIGRQGRLHRRSDLPRSTRTSR